jgi:hypothetical protein
MDWWSVSVEARAESIDGVTGNGEIAVAAMGVFTDLTRPYDGSVVADTERSRWTATLSIEAAGAPEAVAEAARLVTAFAADAGLPGWPVVRATAIRGDALEDSGP